jgi:organic radical activating enzyme
MSSWKEFYQEIRDQSWPDCESEEQFKFLPEFIQQECKNKFGYTPNSFNKSSKLPHKTFPIKTATACQLKWNWSTLFLTTEETASCHRTNHHKFDTDVFDFHNTPSKLDDRNQMLAGEWPKQGCNYCQAIESAGGASDRVTNLDFPGMHAPPELENNPSEVHVTPRILEVYFDNTCNLKCMYCSPLFSSLWDAENKKYGLYMREGLETSLLSPSFKKSPNLEKNKNKLFEWLKKNVHNLTVFNVLGGEPLYQDEFEQCLDLFEQYPAPELKLQIFTNLNTRLPHLVKIVERVKKLIDTNHLREFEVTASLDCWGPEQEYVRFPLDLTVWERNFEYLLSQPWINLIIGSTVTPLTIKTLPTLIAKINHWNKTRRVYHYQNSVQGRNNQSIGMFGNIFKEDFEKALALKSTNTPEDLSSRQYLEGIAKQSCNSDPDTKAIFNLYLYLNELDRRRSTSWAKTFPWLVDEFAKHNIILGETK